ncbi:hypothetical protein A2Z33_05190 [Candidatus Gottesmanbacteria bacterium RBG_16_52_11]|uniref:DNA-3-methyladenine glycosylase II n=1 Tax=Candidatus Gottesmanbacteria bacterium RBG_16_52_11 TaxID=1798374 RepID=A0A1F5YQP2_9BACT|nr:MAG: hypothetical protein A2Z33_05190 [Candidatus Gottesmanbacteria bacterium RBG_16_52_11]
MSVSELRVSGVSESKANYIRNTASAFLDGRLVSSKLDRLTDQEVITVLTSVKGIGRWTAEMFLIFSLGRPDVFSFGDAGLMRAVNRLYGKKRPLTQDQIRKITRRWSPYRSYACILLWRSLA